MKINSRRGIAAFTLVELMAVVTIIIILAGLVVGGLGFVTERQAKEKAKVQLALITKALEEYKLDMGFYPATVDKTGNFTTAGTSTSAILYEKLFKEGYDYTLNDTPPANWDAKKATKIYLPELNPVTSKQGWVLSKTTMPTTAVTITDPWGSQYCYRSAFGTVPASGNAPVNPSTQNPDFDLWSMGKDTKSNGGTTPAALTDARNRDDIRNF